MSSYLSVDLTVSNNVIQEVPEKLYFPLITELFLGCKEMRNMNMFCKQQNVIEIKSITLGFSLSLSPSLSVFQLWCLIKSLNLSKLQFLIL